MSPEQREQTVRRILNWKRWVTGVGGAPRGHCASAEGRYVAPRLAEGEEEQIAVAAITRDTTDPVDAELVDQCLRALHNPLERACIIAWHLGQRTKDGTWKPLERVHIARELNLRPALIDTVYGCALISLRMKLELARHAQYHRPTPAAPASQEAA